MRINNNFPILNLCIVSKVIILGVFILVVLSACATLLINSDWKTDEVVVNGELDEWRGRLYFIEDENFSMGIRNDEQYLYLCFAADNQFIGGMIFARGLTFWFDPKGGKNKIFGIRFPIGISENRSEHLPLTEEERQTFNDSLRQRTQEDRERFMNNMLKEVVILDPEKDAEIQIPIEELRGIELKIDAASGLFVYELRVPLTFDEGIPYAIGISPGQNLGVGIEIPKMDRSAMRGQRPPGGMGGRGGMDRNMPPGGMGGRGGFGSRPGIFNGMDFWVKIKLAEK